MLIVIAFVLGYLTCYLEIAGYNWGGLVAGLAAVGLILLKLAAGELLRPYTKKFLTLGKQVDGRIGRISSYFLHHIEHHETLEHAKCLDCTTS